MPGLVDALRAPVLRYEATRALLAIREGAVAALTAALAHADCGLREGAAKVLGEFGAEAVSAVPALERLLADPVERVQTAARSALERIGGK